MFFEPLDERPIYKIERARKTDGIERQVLRSLMHPQYARRFIKMYLTEGA